MKNKLTPQEIEKVKHGLYYGQCERLLKGLSHEDVLWLTPLSEISDEDAVRLGELVSCWSQSELHGVNGCFSEVRSVLMNEGKLLAKVIDANFGMGAFAGIDGVNINDFIQAIDLAREMGYMIKYKGIDLFEAGIALPKNNRGIADIK